MARPTNKEALSNLSQSKYNELLDLISRMPDENMEFPKGTMNRNVRDVLGHLHHWQVMLLAWYRVGMSGEKPVMPAEGYAWKDTPALNKKIWEGDQQVSLQSARDLLDKSHAAVQEIILKHSDEELFEKKRYRWTGTTSLGSYLISATSSHYDWAIRMIRKAVNHPPFMAIVISCIPLLRVL